MATRTRSTREAPGRRTTLRSGGTARGRAGGAGGARRPPPGDGGAAAGAPSWQALWRAWLERSEKSRERQGLYPFTISGIPIKALYTPEDLAGMDPARDLSFPGEYPYTRGIHPTMYRGRMYTMRQFSGFGLARESNQRYHYLLARGLTGLSIAFDNPTIMGYDSDHPKAHGEVGKCGVAVDSLRDMEILLDGIDPGTISTSMTINGPAATMFGFYLANAEKRGVPFAKLRGTLQNDFFEEIAKLRAARRIWARHMRERYRAKRQESWLMRFHTQTAGCSLWDKQPENNIMRTAFEALAAVLGGTQSLHTNSMDETIALPSDKAVKIALRTQQVIAHELGVTETIDPLAGSYYLETLTNTLEEQAEDYFRRSDALDGV